MANMAQAIRLALHYSEENLNLGNIFGEDVGAPLGGVFTVTQGLKTAWNSPLDERGIMLAAMGIGLAGERCVAEIQFSDYIFNTIDIMKLMGMTHWASHGQYHLPIVVMTPNGAGIHGSIYHSHSFDSWATRLPGWKVVMPSNPLDAYGLMIAAIQDPNPVLYLKPKALLRQRGSELIPGEPSDEKELKSRIDAPLGDRTGWRPNWPAVEHYEVPLGKAKVVIEGDAATIVTFGRQVQMSVEVANTLREEGIAIEVIDLRTLYPYDWQTVSNSIRKTGRVLFVNEDTEVTNFAEHLATRATKECFYHLMAAPLALTGKNVPGVGLFQELEKATVPQTEDILSTVRELLAEVP